MFKGFLFFVFFYNMQSKIALARTLFFISFIWIPTLVHKYYCSYLPFFSLYYCLWKVCVYNECLLVTRIYYRKTSILCCIVSTLTKGISLVLFNKWYCNDPMLKYSQYIEFILQLLLQALWNTKPRLFHCIVVFLKGGKWFVYNSNNWLARTIYWDFVDFVYQCQHFLTIKLILGYNAVCIYPKWCCKSQPHWTPHRKLHLQMSWKCSLVIKRLDSSHTGP